MEELTSPAEEFKISPEEIFAQREAMASIRNKLAREGRLRDLDPGDAVDAARAHAGRHQRASVTSQNVRHGKGDGSLRVPDDEEIAEIRDGDPATAHLYELGKVQPGTAEFAAKYYPPAEPVIDVLGPDGAEGIGVVRRVRGTGPGAGIEEV